MYLFTIPLFLFSIFYVEISTSEPTSSTHKSSARKANQDPNNCVCFPGGQSLVPDVLNPQGKGLERLVVYIYKDPHTNKVKTFIPSPEKQALIPNIPFSTGDVLKTVTTETVTSLIQPNLNIFGRDHSPSEAVPIGLNWGTVEQSSPSPSFYETIQGIPQINGQITYSQNVPFGTNNLYPGQIQNTWQYNQQAPYEIINGQYVYTWDPIKNNNVPLNPYQPYPSNYQINSKGNIYINGNLDQFLTFEQWFNKQMAIFHEANAPEDIRAINADRLRPLIQKALFDNHMHIGSTGQITDGNGTPVNLNNLELRPILIGNSVKYPQTNGEENLTLPKNLPYLEGLLITLVYPPKVLGVIPLGKTYVTQTGIDISSTTPQALIYHTATDAGGTVTPPSSPLNPVPSNTVSPSTILNPISNLIPPQNANNPWYYSNGNSSFAQVYQPQISADGYISYPGGIDASTNLPSGVISSVTSVTGNSSPLINPQYSPFTTVTGPPSTLINPISNVINSQYPNNQWIYANGGSSSTNIFQTPKILPNSQITYSETDVSGSIRSPTNIISSVTSVTGAPSTVINPASSVISPQYPNNHWLYTNSYQSPKLSQSWEISTNPQYSNLVVPSTSGMSVSYTTVPNSSRQEVVSQFNGIWQRRSNKPSTTPKNTKPKSDTNKKDKHSKDKNKPNGGKGKLKASPRSLEPHMMTEIEDDIPYLNSKSRRWSPANIDLVHELSHNGVYKANRLRAIPIYSNYHELYPQLSTHTAPETHPDNEAAHLTVIPLKHNSHHFVTPIPHKQSNLDHRDNTQFHLHDYSTTEESEHNWTPHVKLGISSHITNPILISTPRGHSKSQITNIPTSDSSWVSGTNPHWGHHSSIPQWSRSKVGHPRNPNLRLDPGPNDQETVASHSEATYPYVVSNENNQQQAALKDGQTRRFSMSSVQGVIKTLIDMVLQNLADTNESRRPHTEPNITGSNPIDKTGEDGDSPDFRIIGGSAATGSGSPLSNKGRSGIIR